MSRGWAIRIKNQSARILYYKHKGKEYHVNPNSPGENHHDAEAIKTFIFHRDDPTPNMKAEPVNCNIILAGIREIENMDRMGLKIIITRMQLSFFRRMLLWLFPIEVPNVEINDDP
jgi:hypothetical protein